MRALSRAHGTDVRIYTSRIKLGIPEQRAAASTRLW